jgi:type II secretory pathway pseudopilin PulG
MMKIIKNKKGISLIEIIVGSLMFAIVAISASAAMAPMLRAYAAANEFAEHNTLINNVANQIISDLSRATGTPASLTGETNEVLTGGTGLVIPTRTGDVTYTIGDAGDHHGVLLLRDAASGNVVPVFPRGYYRNKHVSFSVDTGIIQ